MPQTLPTWQIFEDVVRRILEANEFGVELHRPRGDSGFDFLGKLADEEWAIEVKYYRTARAQPSLIEAAAVRVASDGKDARARKGMLVVSCLVPDLLRSSLEAKFAITVADLAVLRRWASSSPRLADELESIVEADLGQPRGFDENQAIHVDPRASSRLLIDVALPPQESRGAELMEELRGVKRGKESWAAYEKLCARILEFLFANDLHGWHRQKRTDDGLNRFDFVCRVRPTTEF